MMDIYDITYHYRESSILAERIAAAILYDLNDRRGIKNELRRIDGDVMEELFRTHVKIISNLLLPAAPDNSEPLPFEEVS
jgi:hypothetical protein